jgi:hypothetical protein
MMTDYNNPDPQSINYSYEEGEQVQNNMSFEMIRKINIDNLEKEYNYILPQCIEIYKKLSLDVDNVSLTQKYEICQNKLSVLEDKIADLNNKTDVSLTDLKNKINETDSYIFSNQDKMNSINSTLQEKHKRIDGDLIKFNDYVELNNSMKIKNIIKIIIFVIFLIILIILVFLYFIKNNKEIRDINE